jgi:hypothetical protein
MKRYFCLIAGALLTTIAVVAQEIPESEKNHKLGITASGNYSYTGVSIIADFEFQTGKEIFYTGPKIPISKSYLPFNTAVGWNAGYRHIYSLGSNRKVSLFFNADYQIVTSKAFSQTEKSNYRNYLHELFIGYGIQYRLTDNVYIGNMIGTGVYFQSFYNADLKWRQNSYAYNNLIKVFLNCKF